MAGLAAIADAVLRSSRALESERPSVVTQALQLGDSDGLSFYLATDTGSGESLADYTGRLLCDKPELAVARSLVVDWFAHRAELAKACSAPQDSAAQPPASAAGGGGGGAFWAFPNSMSSVTAVFQANDGALQFLRAVCQYAGWVVEPSLNYRGLETKAEAETRWMLSSADHALVEHESHVTPLARLAPEFALYRDLAFLFHLALVPWDNGLRVLPLGSWQGRDLRIRWQIQPVRRDHIFFVQQIDHMNWLHFAPTGGSR